MANPRGRSVKTMPKSGAFLALSPSTKAWHEVSRHDIAGWNNRVIDGWRGKAFTPLAWFPLPRKPALRARPSNV